MDVVLEKIEKIGVKEVGRTVQEIVKEVEKVEVREEVRKVEVEEESKKIKVKRTRS